MSRVFVFSDPHFGHKGVLNMPGRMLFTNIESHDGTMIDNWRRTVSKRDLVWLLGDVTMHAPRYFKDVICPQLTGRIKIIGGNHDEAMHGPAYTSDGWEVEVHGAVQRILTIARKGEDRIRVPLIMTHIPIHPGEFYRWSFNIHGHLHHKLVYKDWSFEGLKKGTVGTIPDPRYISVCAEQVDFTPQPLEEVVFTRIKEIQDAD